MTTTTKTADIQATITAHAEQLAEAGYAEGRRATGKLGAVADDHRAARFAFARDTLGRDLTTEERRAWLDAYETRLIDLTSGPAMSAAT